MESTKKPRLHQDWIDPHALGIVKALQKRGHTTYLVGGCVRDLLLGIEPKDFDIGTTALPDEVRKAIYKAYVIGKRFRLVLVKRDQQQYEVATFRRESPKEDIETQAAEEPLDILVNGDNTFGTPEEDAYRRDFTINGLFYDPVQDELIDHPQGIVDLEAGLVRMIGAPEIRLVEDPIRILRALRFAHKIQFRLEPELRASMSQHSSTLLNTALPRRREEILKFLKLPDPTLPFLEAYDLGILQFLSPQIQALMDDGPQRELFLHYLSHFHAKPFDKDNPAELFAHLMLAYVRSRYFPDPEIPLSTKTLLEHPSIHTLMKDELGMFKHEQSLAAKALHMQNILHRRKEFEQRGSRRQMAVLSNDAFILALQMAEKDYSVPAQDLLFWREVYTASLADIETIRIQQNRLRPKRRPRSRRRKTPVAI